MCGETVHALCFCTGYLVFSFEMQKERNAAIIKGAALRLGFSTCGIAAAVRLDDDARRLEKWLNSGFHGGMKYMENHFELRIDPTKLVPGAKSVITLTINYYPLEHQLPDVPKIARYAYGMDYHYVIREKLNALLDIIREDIGAVDGKGFVDSAPILERSWAVRSGVGWIGKNGNVISRSGGSYFFIATLITDLELATDHPFATDHCGTCTRCVAACPTEAIVSPGVVDGSRCISYATIELKDALMPDLFKGKMEGWAFGCDICQEVCPWNRFAKPHQELQFDPIPEVLNLSLQEWETMEPEVFNRIFKNSPLKRAKWTGIQRNIRAIKSE